MDQNILFFLLVLLMVGLGSTILWHPTKAKKVDIGSLELALAAGCFTVIYSPYGEDYPVTLSIPAFQVQIHLKDANTFRMKQKGYDWEPVPEALAQVVTHYYTQHLQELSCP